MRASIAIAAHNEGDRLWKTVKSCADTLECLDAEILVVDDASEDGSVQALLDRFPKVRLLRHDRRWGVSPAKDHAGRSAEGRTIVFLDGHCKPEAGALRTLVEGVEATEGRAVITPCIPWLDCATWQAMPAALGFGFGFELERFECRWIPLQEMTMVESYFESPAFVGCSMAMSKKLYEELRGFDPGMVQWGQEDLDFSLKTWLMGYSILNCPRAVISHRFRDTFDNYAVARGSTVVNSLRMARKLFTDEVWEEWLPRYLAWRTASSREEWDEGFAAFEATRSTVEAERKFLHSCRVHDERWYAEKFRLPWPRAKTNSTVSP
jgi:GT2 family glycosyltransferase